MTAVSASYARQYGPTRIERSSRSRPYRRPGPQVKLRAPEVTAGVAGG